MARISSERLIRQIFDKLYNLKSLRGYAKQMKVEPWSVENCKDKDMFRKQVNEIIALVHGKGRVERTEHRRERHLKKVKEMLRRRSFGKEN